MSSGGGGGGGRYYRGYQRTGEGVGGGGAPVASRYLGEISDPCCIKAPRENHSVLDMVKALVAPAASVPSVSSDTCHSYGEKRPTKKRTKLTAKNPIAMHSQTQVSSGSMKEKTQGFWRSGFLIMMEMPVFMKGLVKSTTLSLSSVMVSGATAMSLSWNIMWWLW